jgi:cell wall-associated NlpC family hydrolase
MTLDIKKILAGAESHVGYKEGENNDTPFGIWFGLNHQPWCAMSASKIFYDAGAITAVAPKANPKGFASCDQWLKYLAKNNQLVPVGQAQAGDIVFYQFDADAEPDHVGIVKGNNSTLKYIYAYEGNTSPDKGGNQSNGDGYYIKKRSYSLIMAIGRPKETT